MVQAGDSIAGDVVERLRADDSAVHRFGNCGCESEGDAAPTAAEATAKTIGAALTAAHAAGQRAVLLVCPAAATLEAEMAALKEAHGAVTASGQPYAAVFATQPVRPAVAGCIQQSP